MTLYRNPVVGIWFWGKQIGGNLTAGSDAKQARYFQFDELPEHIAFPTDRLVLNQLYRLL